MEHKLSKNYGEAYEKFAEWVADKEKLLTSTCHCCPKGNSNTSIPKQPVENGSKQLLSSTPLSNGTSNGTSTESIVSFHRKLQEEVENRGKQLNCELRHHLEEDKLCTKDHWDQSGALESRWHQLWLTSLEQLIIVERNRRCPTHNSASTGRQTTHQLKLHQQTNNNTSSSSSRSPLLVAYKKSSSLRGSPRKRPISYPNNAYTDRLEWDYKNTLSLTGCHKENGSHIDLDSVDEQITKNLTEFGENYELWFGKEDEIVLLDLHSRPSSVEPSEKPEIAKAVIITPTTTNSNSSTNDVNCNLLMLTTPSSIFSVDASKCSRQEKPQASYRWRFFGAFLFTIAALLFSSLYTEPHHIHKSYYHSQPPV